MRQFRQIINPYLDSILYASSKLIAVILSAPVLERFINRKPSHYVDFLLKLALGRKIFPTTFCKKYDLLVTPHLLGKKNDCYLFTDIKAPHKQLHSMYMQFISNIHHPYSGINFLEIGIGAGGISYTAKHLGFDVISTDIGHGLYEEAGNISRQLLSIEPIHFVVGKQKMEPLIKFKNGKKADYIYLSGVPFNRRYKANGQPYIVQDKPWPDRCIWYKDDEWVDFLDDIFKNLNINGQFINLSIYALPEELTLKIKDKLYNKFSNAIEIKFLFYPIQKENISTSITDLRMTRLL